MFPWLGLMITSQIRCSQPARQCRTLTSTTISSSSMHLAQKEPPRECTLLLMLLLHPCSRKRCRHLTAAMSQLTHNLHQHQQRRRISLYVAATSSLPTIQTMQSPQNLTLPISLDQYSTSPGASPRPDQGGSNPQVYTHHPDQVLQQGSIKRRYHPQLHRSPPIQGHSLPQGPLRVVVRKLLLQHVTSIAGLLVPMV